MTDDILLRDRAGSLRRKDLLENQLASITKTLTNASHRRDIALKERMRNKQETQDRESRVNTLMAENVKPSRGAEEARRDVVSAISELEAIFGCSVKDLDKKLLANGDSTSEDSACQHMLEELRPNTKNNSGTDEHTVSGPAPQRPPTQVVTTATKNKDGQLIDATSMHAELEQRQIPTKVVPSSQASLQRMLAEVTERAQQHDNPDKAIEMYTNIHSNCHEGEHQMNTAAPTDTDFHGDEDLETLAARLFRLSSPLLDPQRGTTLDGGQTKKRNVDPCIIPYIVALRLERSVKEWNHAMNWTYALFNREMRQQAEHTERVRVVSLAHEQLSATIKQTLLQDEQRIGFVSKKAKLARRLIVSNIAAGASAEDIRSCFGNFKIDIQSVTMLLVRNPKTGTKTACIDMKTRQAAITASCQTYAIFGLFLDIQLATQTET